MNNINLKLLFFNKTHTNGRLLFRNNTTPLYWK